MEKLENMNVLESEEADKAKDQVSSLWEKYGDILLSFLRYFIFFLNL